MRLRLTPAATDKIAHASTLLLSLFWWLWHLPVYWNLPFEVEAVQQSGFWPFFGAQFVICLALGILCAWVYNGSRGSILMPVLLHVNWNVWLMHFTGQNVSTFVLPLFVIAALVVGVATKGSSASGSRYKKRRGILIHQSHLFSSPTTSACGHGWQQIQ